MVKFTVKQVAESVGGTVTGDETAELSGFAPASAAKLGDLTFAENEKFFVAAQASAATAILVAGDFEAGEKALIKVKNARVASATVLPLFFPEPTFAPGIHPSAVVEPSAKIDPSAHVGPQSVVGERSEIGRGAVLRGANCIGSDCVVGEDSMLFPNVTLYDRSKLGCRVRIHSGSVIGSDGYGYVFDQGRHLKIPQIGDVVIHDDVEIGANVAIDRGALGSTIIGKGTKVDNLVQIAHNVQIGDHSIIVAQVGIAGSTIIGKFATIGGQAGIAGHLKLGDQVTLAAMAGVGEDIPDGETWMGAPAQPGKETKRQWMAARRLPELIKRVRLLERQVRGS